MMIFKNNNDSSTVCFARGLGILFVTVFVAYIVPLLFDKTLYNIDQDTHYRWIRQFTMAIEKGEIYPRWMFMASDGLGELVYSPYLLYWYMASLLTKAGLSVWVTIKTLAFISAYLSGVVAYYFLRRVSTERVALFAAILLSLAPFSLFLFTHYSAYPWHFSLVVAVILILLSIFPSNSSGRILAVSLVTAILALTHVLVAFMALLCIAPAAYYVQNGTFRERIVPFAWTWVLPVIVGLGLAAFHLLPAIFAMGLYNPEKLYDLKYHNWQNSFAFAMVTAKIHGIRWFSIQWIHSTALLFCAIASLVALRLSKSGQQNIKRALKALLLVAFAALTLASELAYPMYEYISLVRNVQFPYRFLSVASIGVMLAQGLAMGLCFEQKRKIFVLPLLVLTATGSLAFAVALQFQIAKDGQLVNMSPNLLIGEFRTGGLQFRTEGPDWRAYVKNEGLSGYCDQFSANCREISNTIRSRKWEIQSEKPFKLVLPLFYFPGWVVFLDGSQSQHGIHQLTGLVEVAMPAGVHIVSIEFVGLPVEKNAMRISIIAVLLLFLLVCIARISAFKR